MGHEASKKRTKRSEWLDDLRTRRNNYYKKCTAKVCEQCGEYFLDTGTALRLETIIDEIRKNKAEVYIINYSEMVA